MDITEWHFIIIMYLNMFFWRFLINHSMFLIFNDTGRTAFKFGRFEYFFVFLLPVFQKISIKNQSRDTWRCCCNTVGCLYGTLNTWSVFFNIMMWYSNIVKWHSHIPAFPQLPKEFLNLIHFWLGLYWGGESGIINLIRWLATLAINHFDINISS